MPIHSSREQIDLEDEYVELSTMTNWEERSDEETPLTGLEESSKGA